MVGSNSFFPPWLTPKEIRLTHWLTKFSKFFIDLPKVLYTLLLALPLLVKYNSLNYNNCPSFALFAQLKLCFSLSVLCTQQAMHQYLEWKILNVFWWGHFSVMSKVLVQWLSGLKYDGIFQLLKNLILECAWIHLFKMVSSTSLHLKCIGVDQFWLVFL